MKKVEEKDCLNEIFSMIIFLTIVIGLHNFLFIGDEVLSYLHLILNYIDQILNYLHREIQNYQICRELIEFSSDFMFPWTENKNRELGMTKTEEIFYLIWSLFFIVFIASMVVPFVIKTTKKLIQK